jgi:hypothetical protein
MHLYLTCDREGAIRGEGIDYVGAWTLAGTFDRDSKRCAWIKSYVGKHKVEYTGLLSSQGIDGSWRIPPFLSGRFRIWPETRSDLTDLYLRSGLPLQIDSPDSIFEEVELPRLQPAGVE